MKELHKIYATQNEEVNRYIEAINDCVEAITELQELVAGLDRANLKTTEQLVNIFYRHMKEDGIEGGYPELKERMIRERKQCRNCMTVGYCTDCKKVHNEALTKSPLTKSPFTNEDVKCDVAEVGTVYHSSYSEHLPKTYTVEELKELYMAWRELKTLVPTSETLLFLEEIDKAVSYRDSKKGR